MNNGFAGTWHCQGRFLNGEGFNSTRQIIIQDQKFHLDDLLDVDEMGELFEQYLYLKSDKTWIYFLTDDQ